MIVLLGTQSAACRRPRAPFWGTMIVVIRAKLGLTIDGTGRVPRVSRELIFKMIYSLFALYLALFVSELIDVVPLCLTILQRIRTNLLQTSSYHLKDKLHPV